MINLPSTLVDESVFAKDAELKKQIEIDREKCLKGGKINDIFN
jgi:putative lipoprotein